MLTKTRLYIDFEQIEFINNIDFKITQNVDEHATLYLTAVLEDDSEVEYIRSITIYSCIEVEFGDDEEYKPIFNGVTKDIKVEELDKGFYSLTINAASKSFLIDLETKNKSFKNRYMTYEEMMQRAVLLPNPLGHVIVGEVVDNASCGKRIGKKNIIIFNETPWEFLKRVANHFETSLVPSLIDDIPKVYVGLPGKRYIGVIAEDRLYKTDNAETILAPFYNGSKLFIDLILYHMDSFEDFDIGDETTSMFIDSKTGEPDMSVEFYISNKEIEIIDNTLIYHYGLSLIDYTLLPEARNEERWKELRKSLKSLEQKNNEEIPI